MFRDSLSVFRRVGITSPGSRFGTLARALRERTAAAVASGDAATPGAPALPGAGVHRPAATPAQTAEGLRERVARLGAEDARATGDNAELRRELEIARAALARHAPGADADGADRAFLFLDPATVRDTLPRDRLPGASAGPDFEELLADIRDNGQNDAITVRPLPPGGGGGGVGAAAAGGGAFCEIAAGRRRLEACRSLGRHVLARGRTDLDDGGMLRVQFSENERREDISALERARWFAEVRARSDGPAKDVAARFGIDPSTLSLCPRLAAFPAEIADRLRDPRRLSGLRARRVMEAVRADPGALPRIRAALDACAADPDPDEPIDALLRAAENRGWTAPGASPAGPVLGARPGSLPPGSPAPDHRHVVHRGRRIGTLTRNGGPKTVKRRATGRRRIGTLTRNGGRWVFRFATAIGGDVVRALAERMGELVAEAAAGVASGQPAPPL